MSDIANVADANSISCVLTNKVHCLRKIGAYIDNNNAKVLQATANKSSPTVLQ